MDFSKTSYITFTIILVLLLKRVIFFFMHKQNKNYPPIPPSLPLIGHLHLFRKPLHHALARVSAQYGPVLLLRFGSRPVLLVSSASVAEECFTKNDIVFANRVHLPSFKHLSYDFTTLVIANYGHHWRNLRRIATVELLSSHRINSFNDVLAEEVRAMVRRLFLDLNSDGSATKVELKSRLFDFSLNNMMRMIAGKRAEDSEESKKFQEMVEQVFELAGASDPGDFLPFVGWMDLQGARRRSKNVGKYRDEIMQKLLEEHKQKKNDEKTMLGHLISLQKEDPDYYTDQIVKGLIIALLSAGTDTSSNTIEWAMAVLLNNTSKLKKLQIEIDDLTENNRILEESDLPNLPYLENVITETLRLYPAAPLLVPHESSAQCTVAGYDVPEKTMLLVNAYAFQRDGREWARPTEFVPERYEGGEGVDVRKFAFGMGRRRCPGEALANRVVGLVVGTMVQCFDWGREGEEMVDMEEGSGLTMPKKVPLVALCRPREVVRSLLGDLRGLCLEPVQIRLFSWRFMLYV